MIAAPIRKLAVTVMSFDAPVNFMRRVDGTETAAHA